MTSGNEFRLGKFGNQGKINLDNEKLAKGGVRREEIAAELQNIFDAFDSDGNHVLTQNEISTMKSNVQSYAKHGNDSIFSNNEAEKMIEQNSVMKNANETAEKLFKFLQNIENKTKNSNVTESVVDKNGNAVVTIAQGNKKITKTYDKANGNDVLSTTTVETDSNGNMIKTVIKDGLKETYKFINGKEVLTERIENEGTPNEKITKIEYNSHGQKTSEIITEKTDNKITKNEYQNGVINKQTITSDTYNEIKELIGSTLKTTYKLENKNSTDITKRKETIVQYNGNDSVETIKDYTGETKIEHIGSDRIRTTKNGVTTDLTKTEQGYTEVITNDKNKNTTTTTLNSDKHKLSQKKIINGKEYSIEYDGNGNTKGIVVQYGEDAEKIAKKFGITKEALLKANGKETGSDFQVGDTIIIPKELEADDKILRGRKDSQGALKDKAIADERARQREIARQKAIALDKQYRAAGLKNYEHKGEKFQYGNETYTVIGTMNNRARLMVKDSKGRITIASWDKKILKESYVKMTTAYDQGKKVKMRNGQNVVVLNSRGDKHGRMIGLDEHGRQVVISGGNSKTDFSDRVVLADSYVESTDVRDVLMTRIKTAKNNNERKSIIDQNKAFSSDQYLRVKSKSGKVYYFDIKTGKAVNLTKQEAAAITKELDNAARGMGTDEVQLSNANAAIVDPAVLADINKYYQGQGYTAGEYKTPYEAFLASEISDSEIYEANAVLVDNNAILDQTRRDEILLTNLTTFGGESANRLKALRAIGTRTDYDNLQLGLARHNRANGYNSHFRGQDALQTTLYNITRGNAVEIDAANRALIDSNEDFLSHDEIIRIQAEVGALYLEAGNTEGATRSQNAEIYAAMDELTTTSGQKIDVKAQVNKADLIIAGYGEFSNDEIAQEAVRYLKMAIDSYGKVEEEFANPYMDAQFGPSGSASRNHQNAEDYAAKAFQLIQNYEVLQLVKKELGSKYDEYIAKISHETKGSTDFSKLQLGVSTPSDLSQDVIDENLATLAGLRVTVSDLEKSHLDDVDAEGWKLDFVNELRQTMFLGTTRADVANQYAMSRSTINKLELAAKGQLVGTDGKPIKFEDAVQQLTGKTVRDLQALNQEYLNHQQYGELGLDITVGVVTMVIPGTQEFAVGKLLNIGGKVFKVLQTVDKASKTYKLAEVAVGSVEAGVKVATVQYAIDRTNLETSVSGNTFESRAAAETKAKESGLNAAAGTFIGGSTAVISEGLSSVTSKVVTNAVGLGADLTASAAIGTAMHGGSMSDYLRLTNDDGSLNTANILNLAMTGVGYVNGVKGAKEGSGNTPPPKVETPQIKPFEETHLAQIGVDGKPTHIGGQKFDLIKQDLEIRLKTANETDLANFQRHIDKISNPKYKAELTGMIEARRVSINNVPPEIAQIKSMNKGETTNFTNGNETYSITKMDDGSFFVSRLGGNRQGAVKIDSFDEIDNYMRTSNRGRSDIDVIDNESGARVVDMKEIDQPFGVAAVRAQEAVLNDFNTGLIPEVRQTGAVVHTPSAGNTKLISETPEKIDKIFSRVGKIVDGLPIDSELRSQLKTAINLAKGGSSLLRVKQNGLNAKNVSEMIDFATGDGAKAVRSLLDTAGIKNPELDRIFDGLETFNNHYSFVKNSAQSDIEGALNDLDSIMKSNTDLAAVKSQDELLAEFNEPNTHHLDDTDDLPAYHEKDDTFNSEYMDDSDSYYNSNNDDDGDLGLDIDDFGLFM